jgi:hypothetical protein
MFGVGVGVRVGGFTPVSSGGGFDPDAQAFFDRVTTAGGTLSETEKSATNQLVLDMKSAGIWSSMKAIYPMVGASAAACAQNLKSSSFTGTFNGGWTFASTGALPNGTSGYMNTTLVPSANYADMSSVCITIYNRTNTAAGAKRDIQSYGANNAELAVLTRYTGNLQYAIGGGVTYPNISNTDSRGFYFTNKTSLTTTQGWKNGTKVINTTEAGVLTPTVNPILIAAYNPGTIDQFNDRECAFSSIGTGLTDTQASNFYTLVQSFQTTLSRQV